MLHEGDAELPTEETYGLEIAGECQDINGTV